MKCKLAQSNMNGQPFRENQIRLPLITSSLTNPLNNISLHMHRLMSIRSQQQHILIKHHKKSNFTVPSLLFISISTLILDMNLLISLSFTMLVSLMLSLVVTLYKRHNCIVDKILPPGVMGLPWIGETLAFYRAQRNNKLYEEFVQPRIQKYGKIFKTRLMGFPTVVINGADANKFLLSNEFKLVVSSWPCSSVKLMGKNCIMAKQGHAHKHIRGIVVSSLNSSCLEFLVPKICRTVENQLRSLCNEKSDDVSFYSFTKVLTFTIVLECLLGIEVKSGMLETFEKVLGGVFATPIDFPWSKFSRAKAARKKIGNVLVGIVREKRDDMEKGKLEEGVNLLSRLVGAMIRDEINEAEVVDNVILLVFAAHDTTSFAIAMTFRMLARHQDCYSILLKEHEEITRGKRENEHLTYEDTTKMTYTWQAAREAMRIFPPIFGSFRKAIDDIQYQDFIIPKGWKVLWTTYGTHYDELYFEDPLSFNPSRFEQPTQPYSFVPFGGGPRLCAGYQLAKLNILVLVHYMVTRYDWSLVYPNEPISVDPLPFPSQGMPIRISPKSKSS